MHLPAPALMTAMSCSRGWRNIVQESDVLWRQKLFDDFPMFDKASSPPLLASDRSVYFTAYDCIVRGMCEGRVARLVDERGVGAVPQKQLERGAMAKPRGEHERCEPCFAKMERARA